MGREISDLVKRMKGRIYSCIGRNDGHVETVGTWFGYEHVGGLSDERGKK